MASEEQCRHALAVHSGRLQRLANVEGLGIQEVSGARDLELVVAVYVQRKMPADQLAPDDVIPKYVVLNDVGSSTPVRVPIAVFEIGELKLQ